MGSQDGHGIARAFKEHSVSLMFAIRGGLLDSIQRHRQRISLAAVELDVVAGDGDGARNQVHYLGLSSFTGMGLN